MSSAKLDRQATAPFLLKLFYKPHEFHRLDEFTPTRQPSSHVQIYTWPNCSLRELTALLTSALPNLFEFPSAGTRVAFRLIFPDMRTPPRTPDAPGRYTSKDMGSVVVGSRESGTTNGDTSGAGIDDDSEQTLQDFKFVVGDWISCVVLSPLPNGDVAPPPSSAGAGRGGYSGPPPRSGYGGGSAGPRENGYYGRGRGGSGFGSSGVLPAGEWRRGERLPEGPSFRGGYGRGRGRW